MGVYDKEKRAILPAKDLTARLSEQMVELDILEVNYDTLLGIAVGGAAHIDKISGYGPHDYVAGDLQSLSDEYPTVTMHQVPLEQVDNLHHELVGMAEMIRGRFESCGFSPVDEEGYFPTTRLVEMLDSGDLVIAFEE